MANELRKGIKGLLYCHSVPDPELASRIVVLLLEKGRMSIKDISAALDVSYPLVLRIVNDMASMGVLGSDREKPEGRGRSRKVVYVNVGGLLGLVENCIRMLEGVREEIKKKSS